MGNNNFGFKVIRVYGNKVRAFTQSILRKLYSSQFPSKKNSMPLQTSPSKSFPVLIKFINTEAIISLLSCKFIIVSLRGSLTETINHFNR